MTPLLSRLVTPLFFMSVVTSSHASESAGASQSDNKQALAKSPQALVDMLSEVAFMPPDEHAEKVAGARGDHAFPIRLAPIPAYIDAASDPRSDITGEELADYANVLAAIANRSREDSEILWGRIQGTQNSAATPT